MQKYDFFLEWQNNVSRVREIYKRCRDTVEGASRDRRKVVGLWGENQEGAVICE